MDDQSLAQNWADDEQEPEFISELTEENILGQVVDNSPLGVGTVVTVQFQSIIRQRLKNEVSERLEKFEPWIIGRMVEHLLAELVFSDEKLVIKFQDLILVAEENFILGDGKLNLLPGLSRASSKKIDHFSSSLVFHHNGVVREVVRMKLAERGDISSLSDAELIDSDIMKDFMTEVKEIESKWHRKGLGDNGLEEKERDTFLPLLEIEIGEIKVRSRRVFPPEVKALVTEVTREVRCMSASYGVAVFDRTSKLILLSSSDEGKLKTLKQRCEAFQKVTIELKGQRFDIRDFIELLCVISEQKEALMPRRYISESQKRCATMCRIEGDSDDYGVVGAELGCIYKNRLNVLQSIEKISKYLCEEDDVVKKRIFKIFDDNHGDLFQEMEFDPEQDHKIEVMFANWLNGLETPRSTNPDLTVIKDFDIKPKWKRCIYSIASDNTEVTCRAISSPGAPLLMSLFEPNKEKVIEQAYPLHPGEMYTGSGVSHVATLIMILRRSDLKVAGEAQQNVEIQENGKIINPKLSELIYREQTFKTKDGSQKRGLKGYLKSENENVAYRYPPIPVKDTGFGRTPLSQMTEFIKELSDLKAYSFKEGETAPPRINEVVSTPFTYKGEDDNGNPKRVATGYCPEPTDVYNNMDKNMMYYCLWNLSVLCTAISVGKYNMNQELIQIHALSIPQYSYNPITKSIGISYITAIFFCDKKHNSERAHVCLVSNQAWFRSSRGCHQTTIRMLDGRTKDIWFTDTFSLNLGRREFYASLIIKSELSSLAIISENQIKYEGTCWYELIRSWVQMSCWYSSLNTSVTIGASDLYEYMDLKAGYEASSTHWVWLLDKVIGDERVSRSKNGCICTMIGLDFIRTYRLDRENLRRRLPWFLDLSFDAGNYREYNALHKSMELGNILKSLGILLASRDARGKGADSIQDTMELTLKNFAELGRDSEGLCVANAKFFTKKEIDKEEEWIKESMADITKEQYTDACVMKKDDEILRFLPGKYTKEALMCIGYAYQNDPEYREVLVEMRDLMEEKLGLSPRQASTMVLRWMTRPNGVTLQNGHVPVERKVEGNGLEKPYQDYFYSNTRVSTARFMRDNTTANGNRPLGLDGSRTIIELLVYWCKELKDKGSVSTIFFKDQTSGARPISVAGPIVKLLRYIIEIISKDGNEVFAESSFGPIKTKMFGIAPETTSIKKGFKEMADGLIEQFKAVEILSELSKNAGDEIETFANHLREIKVQSAAVDASKYYQSINPASGIVMGAILKMLDCPAWLLIGSCVSVVLLRTGVMMNKKLQDIVNMSYRQLSVPGITTVDSIGLPGYDNCTEYLRKLYNKRYLNKFEREVITMDGLIQPPCMDPGDLTHLSNLPLCAFEKAILGLLHEYVEERDNCRNSNHPRYNRALTIDPGDPPEVKRAKAILLKGVDIHKVVMSSDDQAYWSLRLGYKRIVPEALFKIMLLMIGLKLNDKKSGELCNRYKEDGRIIDPTVLSGKVLYDTWRMQGEVKLKAIIAFNSRQSLVVSSSSGVSYSPWNWAAVKQTARITSDLGRPQKQMKLYSDWYNHLMNLSQRGIDDYTIWSMLYPLAQFVWVAIFGCFDHTCCNTLTQYTEILGNCCTEPFGGVAIPPHPIFLSMNQTSALGVINDLSVEKRTDIRAELQKTVRRREVLDRVIVHGPFNVRGDSRVEKPRYGPEEQQERMIDMLSGTFGIHPNVIKAYDRWLDSYIGPPSGRRKRDKPMSLLDYHIHFPRLLKIYVSKEKDFSSGSFLIRGYRDKGLLLPGSEEIEFKNSTVIEILERFMATPDSLIDTAIYENKLTKDKVSNMITLWERVKPTVFRPGGYENPPAMYKSVPKISSYGLSLDPTHTDPRDSNTLHLIRLGSNPSFKIMQYIYEVICMKRPAMFAGLGPEAIYSLIWACPGDLRIKWFMSQAILETKSPRVKTTEVIPYRNFDTTESGEFRPKEAKKQLDQTIRFRCSYHWPTAFYKVAMEYMNPNALLQELTKPVSSHKRWINRAGYRSVNTGFVGPGLASLSNRIVKGALYNADRQFDTDIIIGKLLTLLEEDRGRETAVREALRSRLWLQCIGPGGRIIEIISSLRYTVLPMSEGVAKVVLNQASLDQLNLVAYAFRDRYTPEDLIKAVLLLSSLTDTTSLFDFRKIRQQLGLDQVILRPLETTLAVFVLRLATMTSSWWVIPQRRNEDNTYRGNGAVIVPNRGFDKVTLCFVKPVSDYINIYSASRIYLARKFLKGFKEDDIRLVENNILQLEIKTAELTFDFISDPYSPTMLSLATPMVCSLIQTPPIRVRSDMGRFSTITKNSVTPLERLKVYAFRFKGNRRGLTVSAYFVKMIKSMKYVARATRMSLSRYEPPIISYRLSVLQNAIRAACGVSTMSNPSGKFLDDMHKESIEALIRKAIGDGNISEDQARRLRESLTNQGTIDRLLEPNQEEYKQVSLLD